MPFGKITRTSNESLRTARNSKKLSDKFFLQESENSTFSPLKLNSQLMSTPKAQKPPEIEKLKLSTLVVDIALSGRPQREIDANAKALASAVKSFGAWDMTQPGAFFIRDGKPHLARGFTRRAACLLAGIEEGYFVQIPDNPVALRTEAIRSNMGRPISMYEQGRIYAGMRAGSKSEDLKVGDVALEPMSIEDIASEVGYTGPHVRNCITVFESPKDIAQLVIDGKVASAVAVKAQTLVKDPAKAYKFLCAAVKQAESEKKDCATDKHLMAVKPKFVPVTSTPPKAEKGKAESKPEAPAAGSEPPTVSTETPEQPDISALGSSDESGSETSETTTVTESTTTSAVPASKVAPAKSKRITRDKLKSLIVDWAEECTLSASDEDVEKLLEKLEDQPF